MPRRPPEAPSHTNFDDFVKITTSNDPKDDAMKRYYYDLYLYAMKERERLREKEKKKREKQKQQNNNTPPQNLCQCGLFQTCDICKKFQERTTPQ